MVSGSKLMCPSKVSGESPLSLYYSVICSNCLGNVVIGMEKCGKMCGNVEKCAGDPFSIYYWSSRVLQQGKKQAYLSVSAVMIAINFSLCCAH